MRSFIDFSLNDTMISHKAGTVPVLPPNQAQQMMKGHPKKPRSQPIPTKPIVGTAPPPFILPLYPSTKWGINNPQLHAKWERERMELREANLVSMASPKRLAGPKGGKKERGMTIGKEVDKMKKPLKVLKVIKRVHSDADETEEASGNATRVKGYAQKMEAKPEGKGKMNQAILDKLINEDKVNRFYDVSQEEELTIPIEDHFEGDIDMAGEEGLILNEEEPQTWYHTWSGDQEQFGDEEQWETMTDEENDEMQWEDAQEY